MGSYRDKKVVGVFGAIFVRHFTDMALLGEEQDGRCKGFPTVH
jgi:hypothetical protein